MSLEKAEVKRIAWLARLAIEEEDIPGYSRDLSDILALVEQINAIDTADIKPLSHPIEIKARLRQDVVTETNQRKKFQKIAPAVENGHYLVPRVIE